MNSKYFEELRKECYETKIRIQNLENKIKYFEKFYPLQLEVKKLAPEYPEIYIKNTIKRVKEIKLTKRNEINYLRTISTYLP